MHCKYKDIISFFGYSAIFFLFFAGYNTVSSPFFETTFDSASINHKEVVVESRPVTKVVKKVAPRSAPENPLTIAFNPEHIEIDETIMERLKQNIDSPFFKPKVTPLTLLLDAKRQEPRGQVVGNKLILSTSLTDESERTKVLVHELGHMVDIFFLKKGVLKNDPSDIFYDISWETYNQKKKDLKMADFVSGYALSNKYEDFAESFAFYVFHNDVFALRAQSNDILRKKYDFFKNYVFNNEEFQGTSFQKSPLPSYSWDTTKIPVNTKKYLYYIR